MNTSAHRSAPQRQLFETAPQLFSLWSDDPKSYAKPDAVKVLNTGDSEHAGWTVSMSALEAVRIEASAVIPLPRNDVASSAVPSTRLHARVSWMRAGQGTSIVLDIGTGFRLCIEGCSVEVEVLGPPGLIREVQQNDARPLGSGGTYFDTLLSGQAIGVTTDPVHPNTLTQSVVVPRGKTDIALPLPRFAKRLQAYAPAPAQFAALHYRLGALGPSLADVELAQRRTCSDDLVPQAATHITTGKADTTADRRLTLVWTLGL